MTEKAQPALLDYLTSRYAKLKRSLTQILGSDDLAGDALQDTWLRLQSKEDQDAIQSPGAYLVRMAVNIAVDAQRRQGRSLSYDDVEALMDLSDPAPGPAQLAEGRSDLDALMAVMEELPKRRREILILVRWEGLPQKEVAERLGVTLRTVEHELKRAHDYCDAQFHMKKNRK